MVCVRCRCWAAAICDCAVAVRGVAAVSLLLLPFCVDGELVCAEGCRQVTGVMAMMMTGRVLLVCALCVLWCGAGGGDAWGVYNNETRYYYGKNGVYCKNSSVHSFCDKTTGDTSLSIARGTRPDGSQASATQALGADAQSSAAQSHQASTPGEHSASGEHSGSRSGGNPGPTVTSNSAGGGGPSTVDKSQPQGGGDLNSNHQTTNGDTDPNASLAPTNDGQDTHSSSTPPPANQTEEPKVTEEGEGAPAALTTNEDPTGNPESESENEQRSSANEVSARPPEATEQG
ncbi:mucin-associated surface protein (MASP), putative, partial [Trypanosoma cruzi marinkellei]